MCGLNLSFGNLNSKHSSTLFHRGPDQEFSLDIGRLRVTFNRLAITGGKSGNAPVVSKSGNWTCFLNGEIYNFRKLRQDLGKIGLTSDTQVIAEGLDRDGLNFLKKIHGMYALILIDNTTNRVYVLRDPLGEKPLFYSRVESGIEVSSEFTSLLGRLNRNLRLNYGAVQDYFRFGYPEEPWTFDLDIWSFERGILYELMDDGNPNPLFSPSDYNSAPLCTLPELISQLNSEIIPSDIGQAILLSGGIDSASLLRNLTQEQKKQTISITLQTPGNLNKNEVLNASRNSRKFGVANYVVNWSPKLLINDLNKLAIANDQPHADMAGIAYFKLFEFINESRMKVSVSGHGPDELFWGYPWFNEMVQSSANYGTPRIFWETPASINSIFDTRIAPLPKGELSNADRYKNSKNILQRARYEMVHSYLSHNALRQCDRLAMHWSVEPRTPYSDFRLYLWAQENANQPDDFHKKGFKDAFSRNPFNRIRKRSKRGFDIGMISFLRSQEFDKEFRDIKNSFFRRDLPWKPDIFTSKRFSAREIYRISMLEYWLRFYD